MAEPAAARRSRLTGVAAPRLAPPVPAKSKVAEYEAAAVELGMSLYPWQKVAARYITAVEGKHWHYREVAVVVARQNGKTELLIPRILMGLRAGESILHTAQNRDIPRKTFLKVAGMIASHPDLDYSIRKANGQEEISTAEGGRYKLVAPRSSVRGETADLVLIDEVREQHDLDLMDAMLPTVTARPHAQIIYLSNAGDSDSIVLNDVRRRGTEGDESQLAYLEWSAAPERTLDDRAGWAEANPALGHGFLTMETLEYFHANRPGPSFETEHLCRWVITTQPKVVVEHAWQRGRSTLEKPLRPSMAISMDISGKRASAAIAWQQSDGTIALQLLADVSGDPIDTDRLGPDIKSAGSKVGVTQTAFDSWSDTDLSRHMRNPKPLIGREFANASENFTRLVEAGRLRWDETADVITDDLAWTARKPYENGAWLATKAKADRPVTAALAAIRATWLASGPKKGPPRVY